VYKIEIENADLSFECDENDTVMRAALRAGLSFPYECNVGQCGSCRFDISDGQVESLWDDAPALTDRDRRKGKKLGCQCQPKSDLTIKVRMDSACAPLYPPKVQEAELVDSWDVTHDMRQFVFRTEHEASFKPGQYCLLYLPGVEGPRAYSMCNVANGQNEWHFLIKRVPGGEGSGYLFDQIQTGGRIKMDGPYGLAYFRESFERDIVCVSGGSGLAPLISIATAASQHPNFEERKIRFFFGGRGPADICGAEYLRLLPGYGERITFHSAISLPELDPNGMWIGPVGFIHESVEDVIGDQLHDHEYYVAGPPPMLRATVQMLTMKHHINVGQVHFDRFF